MILFKFQTLKRLGGVKVYELPSNSTRLDVYKTWGLGCIAIEKKQLWRVPVDSDQFPDGHWVHLICRDQSRQATLW